jgi:UDP-N-acetylglucosamine transferase subunit ALG13
VSDPLLLVLLGTDIHPFDRLVTWVQRWLADSGAAAPRCFVQYGSSAAPESPAHDELQRLVGEASVVVCHGGPATIAECRQAGRLPIVVPRDPALGEHVDGHQQRFARMFGRSGLVRLAETEGELRAALDRAVREPSGFATVTGGQERTAAASEPVRLIGDVIDGLIAARRRSPGGPGGRSGLRRHARPR